MKMIEGFATVYKDNSGLVRIYFYPGCDDYGRQIMKIDIMQTDYKFVRYQDKAVEYILLNPDIRNVSYALTNNFTKERKEYSISISS